LVFRPNGDFTFSWSEEKVSKETDTESFSNPNNKLLYNASALTAHPCAERT